VTIAGRSEEARKTSRQGRTGFPKSGSELGNSFLSKKSPAIAKGIDVIRTIHRRRECLMFILSSLISTTLKPKSTQRLQAERLGLTLLAIKIVRIPDPPKVLSRRSSREQSETGPFVKLDRSSREDGT